MSVKFYSLLILPLVLSVTSAASSRVETNVETWAEGENASVETNIKTQVNQNRVEVNVQEQGRVSVKVENGEVTINKSDGLKPTIIISAVPTGIQQEQSQSEETKQPLINLIKDFFSRLFGFFRTKS